MANMLNIEHFFKAITVQYSKDWLFFKSSEHILAMAVWQNVHFMVKTIWKNMNFLWYHSNGFPIQ